MGEVKDWLEGIGLVQYTSSFLDNGYDDLDICLNLALEDLDILKITNVHHRGTLINIKKFQNSSPPLVLVRQHLQAQNLKLGADNLASLATQVSTNLSLELDLIHTVLEHMLAETEKPSNSNLNGLVSPTPQPKPKPKRQIFGMRRREESEGSTSTEPLESDLNNGEVSKNNSNNGTETVKPAPKVSLPAARPPHGDPGIKASNIMLGDEERIAIMNLVKEGKLTIDEAMAKFKEAETQAKTNSSTGPPKPVAPLSPVPRRDQPDVAKEKEAPPAKQPPPKKASKPFLDVSHLDEKARLELMQSVKEGKLSVNEVVTKIASEPVKSPPVAKRPLTSAASSDSVKSPPVAKRPVVAPTSSSSSLDIHQMDEKERLALLLSVKEGKMTVDEVMNKITDQNKGSALSPTPQKRPVPAPTSTSSSTTLQHTPSPANGILTLGPSSSTSETDVDAKSDETPAPPNGAPMARPRPVARQPSDVRSAPLPKAASSFDLPLPSMTPLKTQQFSKPKTTGKRLPSRDKMRESRATMLVLDDETAWKVLAEGSSIPASSTPKSKPVPVSRKAVSLPELLAPSTPKEPLPPTPLPLDKPKEQTNGKDKVPETCVETPTASPDPLKQAPVATKPTVTSKPTISSSKPQVLSSKPSVPLLSKPAVPSLLPDTNISTPSSFEQVALDNTTSSGPIPSSNSVKAAPTSSQNSTSSSEKEEPKPNQPESPNLPTPKIESSTLTTSENKGANSHTSTTNESEPASDGEQIYANLPSKPLKNAGAVPQNQADEANDHAHKKPPKDIKEEDSTLKKEVRRLLRAEKIELWIPPYSQEDGHSSVPRAFVERYAVQLKHDVEEVSLAIEELRVQARKKLKLPLPEEISSHLKPHKEKPKGPPASEDSEAIYENVSAIKNTINKQEGNPGSQQLHLNQNSDAQKSVQDTIVYAALEMKPSSHGKPSKPSDDLIVYSAIKDTTSTSTAA